MIKTLLFSIFFLAVHTISAQLITTTPSFPMDNELITLTFDATKGNEGLLDYTGNVYAHTGVITTESTDDTDWKYVKTEWGENTPETKLTRLSDNKYEFTITPSAVDYYNIPDGEKITKLAFVFRSENKVGGSYKEAKTEAGGDIFVELSEGELSISITSPETPKLIAPNTDFNFECMANSADSIILFINDKRTSHSTESNLSYTGSFSQQGKYKLKAIAKSDPSIVSDSTYVYVLSDVPEAELPSGVIEGINYISSTEATLVLYAPKKENVFVIGDFNNWEMSANGLMNRTADGNYYWKTIKNLTPGKEYIFQYWVDNSIKIGDPYAEKTSDPWNDKNIPEQTYPNLKPYPNGKTSGIATYLQTNADEYEWQVSDFTAPAKEKLVIYELLVRDFDEDHSYQSLINKIDYFKDLGINAIELLPINEFEGNESWGYNPSYYFAPDKYYGSKNKLKEFIDLCHQNGIAVILDMVLNHAFGQSPFAMLYFDKDAGEYGQPSAENPWLNETAKHPFNVGFDFNHESAETKKLVERVVKFWLEEYKVDGYRFDLSKGFTQNYSGDVGAWNAYDQSRVDIWKNISSQIWETNANAYVILEHLGDNSEEKVLSDNGMMLWGKASEEYYQSAMGYSEHSDFNWKVSYKERGWSSPNLVCFMESHDEERVMHQCIKYGSEANSNYKIKGDTTLSLERMALATAFLIPVPGPKMIWQFGEYGYDYSILYNGRTGNKPIKWDYLEQVRRLKLFKMHSAINKAKTQIDAFSTNDFNIDAAGDLKKIHITHVDLKVVVLGNFSVNNGSITPYFQQTGKWYEFYSGDSIEISNTEATIDLQAGEYRMYTSKKIREAENTEAKILGFAFEQQNTEAIINEQNKTISIEIKPGNDISKLVPIYTLSEGARILFPLTDTVDFTYPVKATVISEDLSTTQEYTITVTEQPGRNVRFEVDMSVQIHKEKFFVENHSKIDLIGSFDNWKSHPLSDSDGDMVYTTILPVGLGDNIQFKYRMNGENDGSEEFAENSTFRELTVANAGNVSSAYYNDEKNDENSILSFELAEQYTPALISETNHTVKATVIYGTDISTLTPIITTSYKSEISTPNESEIDFTNPVEYTVTAHNGDIQTWTISVEISDTRSNKANILSFEIDGQVSESLIDTTNASVQVLMPFGSDLTNLLPQITLSGGATISPNNIVDFTTPAKYTVLAQNEIDSKEWTVAVNLAPNTEADILTFSVDNQQTEAIIYPENRYIHVVLKSRDNINSLKAQFTLSENAKAYINDTEQESGITENSFAKEIVYTIVSEDGKTITNWLIETTVFVGINTHENTNYKVYPNPFKNEITVSGINNNAQVKIFNITGELILQQSINFDTTINTTDLTKGIYIIQLFDNENLTTQKVIKQ